MPTAAFLQPQGPDTLLFAKVTPRSSRNEIGEPLGGELRIKIAAPPVDSAANEELVRFLADRLGCRRGSVRIIRGGASRHKTIQISGLSPDLTAHRLGF